MINETLVGRLERKLYPGSFRYEFYIHCKDLQSTIELYSELVEELEKVGVSVQLVREYNEEYGVKFNVRDFRAAEELRNIIC